MTPRSLLSTLFACLIAGAAFAQAPSAPAQPAATETTVKRRTTVRQGGL